MPKRVTINNCVGCSTDFGNCLGSICPYAPYETCVCDECGEEPLEDDHALYQYGDKWLCRECLLDKFPRTDVDDYISNAAMEAAEMKAERSAN